jgi:hypothetical protein
VLEDKKEERKLENNRVSIATHYSEFKHPNLVKPSKESIIELQKEKNDGYLFVLDDKVLKPIFVYKYAQKKLVCQYELEDILKEYNEYQEEIEKEINTH